LPSPIATRHYCNPSDIAVVEDTVMSMAIIAAPISNRELGGGDQTRPRRRSNAK
jgi:hypothetical protein